MEKTADWTVTLDVALGKMRAALLLLDHEDVPADIGAYLDLAASRLEAHLWHSEAALSSETRKTLHEC